MTNGIHGRFFGMRLLRAVVLFCVATTLLGPAPLFGAGNVTRKTVRVACASFDRLMVVNETGNPISGYAYEYIQTIAVYAGWNVEYVPCNGFADCVEKLLSGEADLFYDISYTEERAKLILYPNEPMGSEYYYLYTTQDNATITPGDYAAMNGKTVGATSGTTVTIEALKQWCKSRNVELTIVEYDEIPQKEADLYAGKIDLDLEVSMLAKHSLSAVEKVGSSDYYLVANKERPDLIDDINGAMEKILTNDLNYFTRIQDQYFSDTVLSRNLTNEERKWIADHKVLRVGIFDNYLPFSSMDKNGKPIGAGVDAIREIIRNLKLEENLEIEFICYDNQKDGYKAVESGTVDLMFPAYISAAIKQDFDIMGGKVIATLTSDLAYAKDFGNGKGKRLGVNGNNLMQYYYCRDSFPQAEIVFYDDIQGCLDGLLAGTSDGTFLNSFRTEALLKPAKYHSIKTERAKRPFKFRMAFARDNIGLMLLMDRGLAMLEHDFIHSASYSYAGRMITYTMMDFLREHILPVIILVAFVVALGMGLIDDRIRNRRLATINRELTESAKTIEKQRDQEAELRKQLESALQEAQSASRAKTTFLNNMSHDIRTPMNAIIGFTELAISHIHDTEQVQEYLGTIARSSEHLLSLINDILEMSRIESGKITLNEKVESLEDILNRLRDIVRADIKAKRHEFLIDTENVRNEYIYCDKLRLNQVLLNLVSNAIKYTQPGGMISLQITQKEGSRPDHASYEFRCKDNGIGMSEEFAETIFDSFTREESSTVSGIQGTGLGMAITKNIVEMMGGSISVSSKKGEGTEFVFSVDFRIADKKPVDSQIQDRNESTSDDQANEEDQKAVFEGKKVLMVDDSRLNLKFGSLLLKERGMIVETASNGQMAVDTIREKGVDAYDFVLMDVQMPVMDGYEATSIIRKLPGGDKLTIIAYSANAFEEDREKSLQAGMNGHITKPLKINELLNALKQFIASSETTSGGPA